eukprot:EG_transcript_19596
MATPVRGEKLETVQKKRARERETFQAFTKVKYEVKERELAVRLLKDSADENEGNPSFSEVASELIEKFSFKGDHGFLRVKLKGWWSVSSGQNKKWKETPKKAVETSSAITMEQPKEVDPELAYIQEARDHVAKLSQDETRWVDEVEATFEGSIQPDAVELNEYSIKESRTAQKEFRVRHYRHWRSHPPQPPVDQTSAPAVVQRVLRFFKGHRRLPTDAGQDPQCRAPLLSEHDVVRKQRATRIDHFFKKESQMSQPVPLTPEQPLSLPADSPYMNQHKMKQLEVPQSEYLRSPSAECLPFRLPPEDVAWWRQRVHGNERVVRAVTGFSS